MNITEEILKTRDIAVDFHSRSNGIDKVTGIPYYWHLMRVMLRLQSNDISLLKAAIMHDTLEDTDATVPKLQELGFLTQEIEDIKWCSKNFHPNLSFKKWMQEIGENAPLNVQKIKLSDITDNMSYERNLVFYKKPYFKNKPKIIPNPKTILNMNLDGTIKNSNKGIYERYYFGLNEITKHRPELLQSIYHKDFTDLSMLSKLKGFLYEQDKNKYFIDQKIRVFSIDCKCEIIQDSKGQDYIAATVDNEYMQSFESMMKLHNLQDELDKKLNRDKGLYHITVVNVAETHLLKKNNQFDKIAQEFINKPFTFYVYGIGKIEIENDKSYHVVVDNPEINTILKNNNIKEKNLHITMGFSDKDLHKKPKNKDTVFIKNDEIWNLIKEKPAFNMGGHSIKNKP